MTKKSRLEWVYQRNLHLYVDNSTEEIVAEIYKDHEFHLYVVSSHYLSFPHKFLTFESAKAYAQKTIPHD